MLKKILVQGLSKYPVVINSNDLCVPQIINLSLLECSNKDFVSRLSDKGICLSTNSACCGYYDESVILNEITNDNKKISKTSIRVSISHLTTMEEIHEFLEAFDQVWNELLLK
jgi:cysteine desulfurase